MNYLGLNIPEKPLEKKKLGPIWRIVVDASCSCPNCDEEMETVFRFYPKKGKVKSLSRSKLQAAGFDWWLDNADDIFEECTFCSYVMKRN